MPRPSQAEIGLKCNECRIITDNIEPITIKKTDKGNFRISVNVLNVENGNINKLNKAQLDLIPPEIINAPNGSVFNNTITKVDGGIIPILPILSKVLPSVVPQH